MPTDFCSFGTGRRRPTRSTAIRPSRRSSWAPAPARSSSSSESPVTPPAARCHAANRRRDELLYAVSGSGTLELDGEPHDLQPESGAYVRAGETYVIDNPGPDELLIVSTSVPVEQVYRLAARGDRPLRRPAGVTCRCQAHVPLPRQPGRGLHGRDAVRRHRRALPRARSQPFLRRGGLHRRGRGIRAHRRRIDTPPALDPVFTSPRSRFTASRTRDPA